MSVWEDRDAFRNNPYFRERKHEYGDFTPFYVTITICTILGISLFILNVVLGCCSRYSTYWNDRHTGNRWIVSLWTSTPYRQPPLDLTELEVELVEIPQESRAYTPPPAPPAEQVQFVELQKRESDI